MKFFALLIAHMLFALRSIRRIHILLLLCVIWNAITLFTLVRKPADELSAADASTLRTFINANGTMPTEWQVGGPTGPGWLDDDSGSFQAVVADASAMVGIRGKTLVFAFEVNNNDAGPSDAAAPFVINWTAGQKQEVFLTGNATFSFIAPTGPANLILRVIQSGAGSNLVTWPGTVKWVNSTPPTLSTAANAIDIVAFYYNGTNYFGVLSPNFGWNVDFGDLASRYAVNDNGTRKAAGL